jgi:hypothetical protein
MLAAPPAAAQNYILNAYLHDNELSWKAEPQATAHWATDDAAGSVTSGSLEVTNTHTDASQGQGVTQCLPVVPIPGTQYGFGARVKILPGQARTGSARIGTRFYNGPHCQGSPVGGQPRTSTQSIGSWVTITRSDLEIPADALSVLFLAFPSKIEAGGSFTVRFDDLYLQLVFPFVDGFDTGDAAAWTRLNPAVITTLPYRDKSKIANISRIYCKSGHCPWPPSDALHDGYDFTPTEDLVEFQASCDGVVTDVALFPNSYTGNYQVNVMFDCDADNNHGVVYAFEPISTDQAVGQQQVDLIPVKTGDAVKAGELLGKLLRHDPSGAHVHYGVYLKGPVGQICPDRLFSSSVRAGILDIVRDTHPDWNLCH